VGVVTKSKPTVENLCFAGGGGSLSKVSLVFWGGKGRKTEFTWRSSRVGSTSGVEGRRAKKSKCSRRGGRAEMTSAKRTLKDLQFRKTRGEKVARLPSFLGEGGEEIVGAGLASQRGLIKYRFQIGTGGGRGSLSLR